MKKIICVLGLSAIFCSCNDFLEEYSLDKDYIRSWEDLDELLIGDCYLPVKYTGKYASFNNPGMFLHLLADEMEENNLGSGNKSIEPDAHWYMFGPVTWQPRMGATVNGLMYYPENREWTLFYKYINVANNVITSVESVPRNTNDEITGYHKVLGEALFIRAFYYFWLVNVYGQPYDPSTAATSLGVPLKTTPEIQDKIFQRNTVKECYDQIRSDLLSAEEHLSQVAEPGKTIYRADVTAVRMLLSRVFLFMQNWEQAAKYARMVIDAHPSLENVVTSSQKFMTTSNPENIFTMGGSDVRLMTSYNYQSERVSIDLYNAYSENDARKSWFWRFASFIAVVREEAGKPLSEVTSDNSSWYYNYYTYTGTSQRTPVSSLFWLRSAEAYMNLAEAEAYLGHEQEARTALSTLLKNRYMDGAPELALTETGRELVSRIRNERRLEFPVEGHRWFDLRRYRVCEVQPEKVALIHKYTVYVDNSTGDIVETRRYRLEEDDASWTVNIPNEVLEFNTGMPGNGNVGRSYDIVPTEF